MANLRNMWYPCHCAEELLQMLSKETYLMKSVESVASAVMQAINIVKQMTNSERSATSLCNTMLVQWLTFSPSEPYLAIVRGVKTISYWQRQYSVVYF